MYLHQYHRMYEYEIRRVTANLPKTLLEEACDASGTGITETLIAGLELVKRTRALKKAQKLKGKLMIDIDLEASRERAHR